MDAFIARQPILDAQKQVFGYELLFRGGMQNMFPPKIDGDRATFKVLSSSFLTLGLEKITGGKRAFINFTHRLLVGEVPLMFPRDHTVVEILEDVVPDREIVRACRNIAAQGYRIALDDFIYKLELTPLIEVADIVKYDLQATPTAEIRKDLQRLKTGSPLLLAEKVETHEDFRMARELGFDLFQGYFFRRPEIIRSKEIPTSQRNLIQILVAASRPDVSYDHLAKLIRQDVGLSYKLLRLIEGQPWQGGRPFASMKEAILHMGPEKFRRFLSFMAMSDLAAGKPDELVRTSCTRVRFLEAINNLSATPAKASEVFMLGVFSLLDAILDQPMAEVMRTLPLETSVAEALVKRRGQLGQYLRLVESYENGDWQGVEAMTAALSIPRERLAGIFADACEWGHYQPPLAS